MARRAGSCAAARRRGGLRAGPDGPEEQHEQREYDRLGQYLVEVRTHERTRVVMLVQDLDVRIIDAATGELLRQLTINPAKRQQGTGRPPGPQPQPTE